MAKLLSGDFSGLSSAYSKNRPDYCKSVLNAVLGLHPVKKNNLRAADIGAGTGIWTRMLLDAGLTNIVAVEPNNDMRNQGEADTRGKSIEWVKGIAESTGLADSNFDLVCMASSFHWTDFELATKEFHRILAPEGRFVAIWNPRLVEVNPLLMQIENYLKELRSDLKRVSSGRSGMTDTLTARLNESKYFNDVVYVEGRHEIVMTRDRYIGAWRSVNDLQVQLGKKTFEQFMSYVSKITTNSETITATYLTRAWSALKSKEITSTEMT
jgi:SAM-dependent methyltransferase